MITGRIDDQGRVLLPIILVASDGTEVEVEASISLEFDGYLAVDEELAQSLGWRSLGARRVLVGFQTCLVDQYIGTVMLGVQPHNVVALGGVNKPAVTGKRLLASGRLTVDFASGRVDFE